MKRLTLCLLFLIASCKTTQDAVTPDEAPAGQEPPIHLTIVGTNDVHGWVMPLSETFPKGDIRYGGVATFASYLKVLRDENQGGVVLVDGGDLFQGTLMSNVTEGSVVIDAFNMLRYDAAAIGNHEFDYGPVGPISAVQLGQDPFGALKARIKQAKFPLLSTNIYETDGQRPKWLPGDGTVIINRKGVRIGIVGLTTPQTPSTTLPINVSTLKFRSLAPEAMTAAKLLREKGADIVIATVHAGGKCVDLSNAHDTSSCDISSGEIFEMLEGIPPRTFDAVVAGHTHAPIAHFVNGTPVIESWALGRYFGTIELYLDFNTRRPLADKTVLHAGIEVCETFDETTSSCDVKRLKGQDVKPITASFHGRPIVPDETVAQTLAPAERQVAEMQNRDLGITVPQTLGRNYENESALGSFLADSLRSMYKADIALMNPGGLRADLPAGALHYGQVYEVIPFDNAVATVEVTGEQLKRLLKSAFGSKKGVFQVSGLSVQLSRCPSPDRLKSVTLANGQPVDPAQTYKVVMPDFLARGGDGLGPVLATIEPRQVDLGETRGSNLRDELVSYWQEQRVSIESPKTGRVTFSADAADCAKPPGADSHVHVP